MKTDNVNFTSKNLIKGKAPEIKELTELIYEKMAAREANIAKRKNVPEALQIRMSDLTNDRFAYERTVLFSTGSDIKELDDFAIERTISQSLGKVVPKLAESINLPKLTLDAKALINGIKDKTIDAIELLF